MYRPNDAPIQDIWNDPEERFGEVQVQDRPIWTYEYNNNVGPSDERFWEWFDLFKNSERVGRTDTEETAKEICNAMNANKKGGA